MANPRQAERDMSQTGQAGQEVARKIAEETSRAARKAADAGAGVARAGADMAQSNAEAMEQVWQSGSEMAAHLTERSMDQLARAFGIGGDRAQNAAQQSARNLESIVQSGTIMAGGLQNVSREWFDFARNRMRENLSHIDALVNSRTPHEFWAAHSNLVRDNLEEFVHSARRTAEISARVAEEAAQKMTNTSIAPQ
jgi:phasin family protein